MPKINLTDEDKIKLLEAINAGVEPSPDFLTKLFPGTAEKFDVKALDRAKIPTLEYAGKRSKAAILAEAGAGIGAAPLQVVRSFGETKEGEWQNMIVQGDNLQFLKTCYRDEDPLIKGKVKGKVKLIYIDPPFATKSDFGGKDGERSYNDKIATSEFIETLRERLLLLSEILHKDGSIYVHLDQKMVHGIKITLDEIFGKENFVNEIIWKRTFSHGDSGQGAKHLGRLHDVILLYRKSENFTLNSIYTPYSEKYIKDFYKYTDNDGRVYRLVTMAGPGGAANGNPRYEVMGVTRYWMYSRKRMQELLDAGEIIQTNPGTVPQRKKYLDEGRGVPLQDIWVDISPVQGGALENCFYPTQKPEAFLDRVVLASSNPGDIVLDCFAGSGSAPAVAEKLGRRWISCDFGKHAIYTQQRRMLRIGESKALVDEKDDADKIIVKKGDSYSKDPKPFSVISAGAYDFSHVMALGTPEHKNAYIAFVLGLFQLVRDEGKASKTKLTNIYAEKDGAPVEVFPVWDEHHFKNVKIDEDYLQSIITQGAGRLHREYHIIVPEHCTNIGDTRLKNPGGQEVIFKFLTFPYKVLEDVSRHLELHEQPASQGAVNELITSTAFYFNEDVEIEILRDEPGLKITKFETKILNKEGNRFPGLEGLAMLLVDVNHEVGKPFDMDKTVFAKDINAEGFFTLNESAKKKIAVIAIDKHGNESKPFIVTK